MSKYLHGIEFCDKKVSRSFCERHFFFYSILVSYNASVMAAIHAACYNAIRLRYTLEILCFLLSVPRSQSGFPTRKMFQVCYFSNFENTFPWVYICRELYCGSSAWLSVQRSCSEDIRCKEIGKVSVSIRRTFACAVMNSKKQVQYCLKLCQKSCNESTIQQFYIKFNQLRDRMKKDFY